MSLIDGVRDAIEREITGLDPDGDVMPTLLYRNADDERAVLGLATNEEMADSTAMFMTASLMVDEAIEAFYSSFCWTVTETREEVVERTRDSMRWQGPMPSQHPDRVEQAMLVHYTPDGASFHFAPVIRSPHAAPTLGPWREDAFLKLGGRIAHALEAGLKMSATMPDELRAVFRAARAAGQEAREGAIRGVMSAMRDES